MSLEPPDAARRALLAALPLLALAEASQAQDAVQVQPQGFRVAFENDKVRVLEHNSRPGMGVCGDGMHSHPAHLTVLLSSGQVRIRTSDGKVQVTDNLPLGTVFWSEAETHETENISGNHMRFLLIELKDHKS